MRLSIARGLGAALATFSLLALAPAAQAQKKYDTGASDTEIKVGNFVPYSGPASAYGTIGKTHAAYFAKLNAEGGINGRKITYLSADDAYNPAQSVEQTRKLVERDGVLLMFGALGTSHNQAVQRYMNQRKVPQLFVSTGATRWGDPKNFPWTMGWQPTYQLEGAIFARHIMATRPNAKVGILMQNDDFGKDYLKGVMDGFGDKAKQFIVSQQTYEVTDPTVDSQMVALKGSGADTFINITTPKFAAQSIRKAADIGWKPAHYLVSVSLSISSVIKPAGADNAQGIITATYLREPSDPSNQGTRELADYLAFMKQYHPAGDPNDSLNVIGYSQAQTLAEVLRRCGDDLTRANVMKQAASLKMALPMLYPGITLSTGADDFFPIKKMQPVRFDGTRYVPFGELLGS
ncbi:ABC transporter substrate-binding protein [Pseudacidovorax sp. NFM-22]|uniref:ABC transporter substrate-binding protein n=1 Tax=Pseudacidovorax sp. NFM-22 TaxID=2744469 RepID=UPI001F15DF57|nr:ABC transporter substrate-binding protein [Pseudacidovorax sp. NFM-22]